MRDSATVPWWWRPWLYAWFPVVEWWQRERPVKANGNGKAHGVSGEAKPVTVICRDGQWLCWGCKTPAGGALPQMPPAAAAAGSAHLVAAIPHKPGCVLS